MWGRPSIPPSRSWVRADTGSTRYHGPYGPGIGLMLYRSAVPGNIDPGPRSCEVDQISRPTRFLVQADTGSTSYPGPFGPESKLTPGQSAVLAYSDPSWGTYGVDQLSRPTCSGFELRRDRPAVPLDSDFGRRSLVSTNYHVRLGPGLS